MFLFYFLHGLSNRKSNRKQQATITDASGLKELFGVFTSGSEANVDGSLAAWKQS
jgi:hypothetical protein